MPDKNDTAALANRLEALEARVQELEAFKATVLTYQITLRTGTLPDAVLETVKREVHETVRSAARFEFIYPSAPQEEIGANLAQSLREELSAQLKKSGLKSPEPIS